MSKIARLNLNNTFTKFKYKFNYVILQVHINVKKYVNVKIR